MYSKTRRIDHQFPRQEISNMPIKQKYRFFVAKFRKRMYFTQTLISYDYNICNKYLHLTWNLKQIVIITKGNFAKMSRYPILPSSDVSFSLIGWISEEVAHVMYTSQSDLPLLLRALRTHGEVDKSRPCEVRGTFGLFLMNKYIIW